MGGMMSRSHVKMIPFGKERPDPGTGGATTQRSLNAVLAGTGKEVPDRLASLYSTLREPKMTKRGMRHAISRFSTRRFIPRSDPGL